MHPDMPGVPVNPMAAGAPAGVVPMDVPCRKCGYNLRGLPVEGRCPECGIAVGLSTYGDLLRYSDPTWLAKLRAGATLILWGIVVMVVTTVLLIVVVAIIGIRAAAAGGGTAAAATPPHGMQAVLISLAGLPGYALLFAGSWFLTEPDPSGLGEDQYGTSRKLIRVTLGLGALNYVMGASAAAASVPARAFVGVQAVNFVFQIVSLVGTLAQLQYLKKLAMRVPDDSLAGRAQTLTWGIGVSYGSMLVLGFGSLLIFRPGTPPPGMSPGSPPNMGLMGALAAIGCLSLIAGIASLVFGIIYVFMLERFRRAFSEQAAAAQATWAAITTAGGGTASPLPGMA
jgi:hypothetical protein